MRKISIYLLQRLLLNVKHKLTDATMWSCCLARVGNYRMGLQLACSPYRPVVDPHRPPVDPCRPAIGYLACIVPRLIVNPTTSAVSVVLHVRAP